MKSQIEKSLELVALHQPGSCFVIPNPWDIGSAKLFEYLGFKALASTSGGFSFSQGRSDLSLNVRQMLPSLRALVEGTHLPITADLQNGFGDSPEETFATITAAAEAGCVGGSIEDASGDALQPIYDIGLATDRIRSAAEAARKLNFKFMLTARAENYLYGRPDLKETIRRLQAYQEAGADVLYAPGITAASDIREIVRSIDRPLNVLAGMGSQPLTVDELRALGVTRISVGGSLARAAYGAAMVAAQEILSSGTFMYAERAISGKTMNAIFSR